MEFPEIFLHESEDDDEAAAGTALAAHLVDLGIDAPFVLSSVHGLELAQASARAGTLETPPVGATQRWSLEMGARAQQSDADAIVAIGGGRCLDVGKLAASRAGLTLIAVPTQLSHDGICSPVAVVPPEGARCGESLGAIAPRAVFVSLPTLRKAPVDSLRAGIGDLLANPLALRDWSLAVDRGLEDADARAWDLSVESFERVEHYLDQDPTDLAGDGRFLRALADGLVLSGLAMIACGTSRPASGAEHEISHAIDELYGGRALHGAQVAFGCLISVALHGEDTDAFRGRLARLGLPERPRDLGFTSDDVVNVIQSAPATRPGRFTILEQANLDEDSARAIVARVWREGTT
ncbi:MAG: iron-containing alcohol dehydrogenase [Actinomycetota bacterium]